MTEITSETKLQKGWNCTLNESNTYKRSIAQNINKINKRQEHYIYGKI